MQNEIKRFIEQKLDKSIVLEKPKDISLGHFATPVAFSLAKELRKNPDLLDPNHPQNKEKNKRPKLKRRGDDEPVIMAKDGKFVCRGVGAAIGGTGFSGVK